MEVIGFTTTCLNIEKEISLAECIELIKDSRASAVEISLKTPEKLLSADFYELANSIRGFQYVSMHTPAIDIRYGDNALTRQVLSKLEEAKEMLGVSNFVLHPHLVEDFDILSESGLNFLIENMDIRKPGWKFPEEFRQIKEKYNFNFVFDAQHAYEHDFTAILGMNFIELFGDRLGEVHLSGCNDRTKHALVCEAINEVRILQMLSKLRDMPIDVPVILEGQVFDGRIELMRAEIEFLKK